MEQFELTANIRKTTGNSPARVLRSEGKLPAVLYGRGTETFILSINTIDLEQIFKKGNPYQVLINLTVEDGKNTIKPVMIKELQTHPLTQDFLHIDFYEIDMKRKITTSIPVVTTGIAKGVEIGGILQIVRRELEVLCLPTEIPERIVIDVTELDMGDSIHAQEIQLEGDVVFLEDTNFTVVTVLAPKIEEEPEEEEEEVEGEEGEEGVEGEEGAAEEEAEGDKKE